MWSLFKNNFNFVISYYNTIISNSDITKIHMKIFLNLYSYHSAIAAFNILVFIFPEFFIHTHTYLNKIRSDLNTYQYILKIFPGNLFSLSVQVVPLYSIGWMDWVDE